MSKTIAQDRTRIDADIVINLRNDRERILRGMLDRSVQMGCQSDTIALRSLIRAVKVGGYDELGTLGQGFTG